MQSTMILNEPQRKQLLYSAQTIPGFTAAVDALECITPDMPDDVAEACRSAAVRVATGGQPTKWEAEVFFAWLARTQQVNRYGKAVH